MYKVGFSFPEIPILPMRKSSENILGENLSLPCLNVVQ
jgi:hypothetical protein